MPQVQELKTRKHRSSYINNIQFNPTTKYTRKGVEFFLKLKFSVLSHI